MGKIPGVETVTWWTMDWNERPKAVEVERETDCFLFVVQLNAVGDVRRSQRRKESRGAMHFRTKRELWDHHLQLARIRLRTARGNLRRAEAKVTELTQRAVADGCPPVEDPTDE